MKRSKFIIIFSVILISIFFTSTALGANFVAPARTLTRVEDEGGLLSFEEEERLREKLDEISIRQGLDVIVLTNYSLGGKSPREFADDYFDYNGYGLGPNYDGVLLLVSMEERDLWISTHGYGITAFTDYGIDLIGDEIARDLGRGEYFNAFNRFASLADDYITQAKNGNPVDISSSYERPKKELTLSSLLGIGGLSLLVGSGAGGFYAKTLANTHKTKKRAYTAVGYQLGVANFVNTFDRFINRTVSRTPILQNRPSGRGGSSTHTSSSGRTHGGGGRKF